MTTPSDAQLAVSIAEAAGQFLLRLQGHSEASGKALGAEGDSRSNELILSMLADARPEDSVLSEESVDDHARLDAERVWIVDPLDGTREYSMRDRADWAVHVALWTRGAGLVAGAVAQPARGEVYASDRPIVPSGARLDEPVILVSDSRPPDFAGSVAEAIGGRTAPMGSAGAKAMAVLRGEADAYLHAGGQWEWDSAAPVIVAGATGFHTSRIDGSPLIYNEPHPYLPDLLICRPDLAAPLLSALKEHI